MTATYPRRSSTRYRGVVYGIDVIDHLTGQVVRNDYVGQTRQRGRGRENQHRDDQPWSDLIVGSPRVLWEGLCNDAELDEMERRFIQDVPVRPRLNWKLNEDNPQQIPKWVLEAQRLEREPGWVPGGQRRRGSLLEWHTGAPAGRAANMPVRARKPWRPWQKHLLAVGVVWLVLTVVALSWLAHFDRLTQDSGLAAPVVALAAGVWGWFGFPLAGRRWRRRFRNARRRFR